MTANKNISFILLRSITTIIRNRLMRDARMCRGVNLALELRSGWLGPDVIHISKLIWIQLIMDSNLDPWAKT